MEADAIHELTPAYALDALDEQEEREYEEHLARCPTCRAELASFLETATSLAYGVESPSPPPRLRDRIVEQAREAGEHPTLDRTDGLTEPLGQLRLREPAVVGELERLPLLVRELVQRCLDALPLQAHPGLLVDRAAALLGHPVERVGAPALLGQVGIARGALTPEGQVLVQGELWRAVARTPVEEGSRVRVVDVNGLTLTVEKAGEGRAS